MWIVVGFAALGFLIGNLVALTSESAVNPLISLLFVFVGGSVLGFLHKLNDKDRTIAGASVLSLSLCCLGGVYIGIWTNQHRWLSPSTALAAPTAAKSTSADTGAVRPPDYYLRAASGSDADLIDRVKQRGEMKADDAYERMYQLARAYEQRLDAARARTANAKESKE